MSEPAVPGVGGEYVRRGELVAAMSLSVATSRVTRAQLIERLVRELDTARSSFATLL
jgi:IclR family pca regulon transcriptional regulator